MRRRIPSNRSNDLDDLIGWVYETVDRLLTAGQFEEVDAHLSGLDVEHERVGVILSFASITLSARQHLPSRPEFMRRARKRVRRVKGERADEILAGLDEMEGVGRTG